MTTTMDQMVIELRQELFTSGSSCCTSPDCSSSTGKIVDHSPSSERYCESHRCERSWTSEGILWQGRGFPTDVKED